MSAATLANVSASATSVALFAAEGSANLVNRIVDNDSAATLYLKYGETASTSSYTVKIPAGGHYEFPQPVYDGLVHGIWSSATGAARCTEVA